MRVVSIPAATILAALLASACADALAPNPNKDDTAPVLMAVFPSNISTSFPKNGWVVVDFDDPILPSSVADGASTNILVRDLATGQPLPCVYLFQDGGRRIHVMRPGSMTNFFRTDRDYEFVVRGGGAIQNLSRLGWTCPGAEHTVVFRPTDWITNYGPRLVVTNTVTTNGRTWVAPVATLSVQGRIERTFGGLAQMISFKPPAPAVAGQFTAEGDRFTLEFNATAIANGTTGNLSAAFIVSEPGTGFLQFATNVLPLRFHAAFPSFTAITAPLPSSTVQGVTYVAGSGSDAAGLDSVETSFDGVNWTRGTFSGPTAFQAYADTRTVHDQMTNLRVRLRNWSGRMATNSVVVRVSNWTTTRISEHSVLLTKYFVYCHAQQEQVYHFLPPSGPFATTWTPGGGGMYFAGSLVSTHDALCSNDTNQFGPVTWMVWADGTPPSLKFFYASPSIQSPDVYLPVPGNTWSPRLGFSHVNNANMLIAYMDAPGTISARLHIVRYDWRTQTVVSLLTNPNPDLYSFVFTGDRLRPRAHALLFDNAGVRYARYDTAQRRLDTAVPLAAFGPGPWGPDEKRFAGAITLDGNGDAHYAFGTPAGDVWYGNTVGGTPTVMRIHSLPMGGPPVRAVAISEQDGSLYVTCALGRWVYVAHRSAMDGLWKSRPVRQAGEDVTCRMAGLGIHARPAGEQHLVRVAMIPEHITNPFIYRFETLFDR